MVNNVKYEVSVIELLIEIKRKWKLVCLIMMAFVLLCGGYRTLTSNTVPQTVNEKEYAKNMECYEAFLSSRTVIPDSLKREWERTYRDRAENPIFTVDPYRCEYEQIVLRFNDDGGNHDWTVNNWISKADNRDLFGNQEKALSDYKSVLIRCAHIIEGQASTTDETVVQVLSVENFDAQKAANYLVNHFKKCAVKDNLNIEAISEASIKGYNETIAAYQERNRSKLTSLYNTFDYSNKMNQFFTAPSNTQVNQSNRARSILKYCLFGLILGFVLGAGLVAINVIRKREIISKQQIEEAFNLALLSDFSLGSKASLDVLNANLDVMTGEHSKIAIVADDTAGALSEISSKWSKESGRSFIVCTDIFDNPEMIEALRTAKGIVIGTKIGTSKLDQIQRVLLRADKLNIRVLGFILL